MGKKKKFYTYFYVKYLPFPFLLFMNNHFLRARLRRMLWENFHLIKSVVLAKNLDVTKVTNNYRCTNRRAYERTDGRQTIFYTKAVTVLLLNLTCLIFFSNQSFKNVMIQHTLYTCLDEHS